MIQLPSSLSNPEPGRHPVSPLLAALRLPGTLRVRAARLTESCGSSPARHSSAPKQLGVQGKNDEPWQLLSYSTGQGRWPGGAETGRGDRPGSSKACPDTWLAQEAWVC